MKPPLYRQISGLPYLEIPHSHDPTAIADFAALPAPMLLKLPRSIHEVLWAMQESMSVLFASYNRLQELFKEQEDRSLTYDAVTGQIECENVFLSNTISRDW